MADDKLSYCVFLKGNGMRHEVPITGVDAMRVWDMLYVLRVNGISFDGVSMETRYDLVANCENR